MYSIFALDYAQCKSVYSISTSYAYTCDAGRLARSNDPSSTDYSGRSLSITLVGSGAPGPIRPLICYTLDTNNVQWIFPDGSPVRLHSSHPSSPAQGSDVFSFDTNDGRGITFNRGPEYLTSGEHCCIRRGTSQRLCVILSKLIIVMNKFVQEYLKI